MCQFSVALLLCVCLLKLIWFRYSLVLSEINCLSPIQTQQDNPIQRTEGASWANYSTSSIDCAAGVKTDAALECYTASSAHAACASVSACCVTRAVQQRSRVVQRLCEGMQGVLCSLPRVESRAEGCEDDSRAHRERVLDLRVTVIKLSASSTTSNYDEFISHFRVIFDHPYAVVTEELPSGDYDGDYYS